MNPDINFNVDQVRDLLNRTHLIKTRILPDATAGLHWLGVYPKWTDHAGEQHYTVLAGPFGLDDIRDHAHVANIGVFKYKRDTEEGGDLLGDRSFARTVREDEVARAITDYAEGVWEYPDAEDLEDPARTFFSGEWLVIAPGEGTNTTEHIRWEYCVEGVQTGQWSGGCSFLADRDAVEYILQHQPEVAPDSWFQWHGDTLIYVYDGAAWDAVDGEPSVMLVEPQPGGEYEMGFGWTWYEVNPLQCDYVIPSSHLQPTAVLPAEPYRSLNPNVNCLKGMRCPQCGQTGEIEVKAVVWVQLQDDGIVEERDHDYDLTAPAHCAECNFTGTWGDFVEKPTMTAGQMITELSKLAPETPLLGYGGKTDWYMNVDGVHFDPGNPDIAATIEMRDDYDTRQW